VTSSLCSGEGPSAPHDLPDSFRTGSPPTGGFSSFLLKAIALYGWPTEQIQKLTSDSRAESTVEGEVKVVRPQYLPTWAGLASVTGAKIVRPQKLMSECHEVALAPPVKSTSAPLAKAAHVNTVKIFLSLHDDPQIIRTFESYSPGRALACLSASPHIVRSFIWRWLLLCPALVDRTSRLEAVEVCGEAWSPMEGHPRRPRGDQAPLLSDATLSHLRGPSARGPRK
jgi:hypothetical protein